MEKFKLPRKKKKLFNKWFKNVRSYTLSPTTEKDKDVNSIKLGLYTMLRNAHYNQGVTEIYKSE